MKVKLFAIGLLMFLLVGLTSMADTIPAPLIVPHRLIIDGTQGPDILVRIDVPYNAVVKDSVLFTVIETGLSASPDKSKSAAGGLYTGVFDRGDIVAILPPPPPPDPITNPDWVTIHITGQRTDGTTFVGISTIKVSWE